MQNSLQFLNRFLLFSLLITIIVIEIIILIKIKTRESYSPSPSQAPLVCKSSYSPTIPPSNTVPSAISENPFTINTPSSKNIKFYYSYNTTSSDCANKCNDNSNCGGYFYTGDSNTVSYNNNQKNCFLTFGSKANNGTLSNISNASAIYCAKPSPSTSPSSYPSADTSTSPSTSPDSSRYPSTSPDSSRYPSTYPSPSSTRSPSPSSTRSPSPSPSPSSPASCRNFCLSKSSNVTRDDIGFGTAVTGQICCCGNGVCCQVDSQLRCI